MSAVCFPHNNNNSNSNIKEESITVTILLACCLLVFTESIEFYTISWSFGRLCLLCIHLNRSYTHCSWLEWDRKTNYFLIYSTVCSGQMHRKPNGRRWKVTTTTNFDNVKPYQSCHFNNTFRVREWEREGEGVIVIASSVHQMEIRLRKIFRLDKKKAKNNV